MEKLLEAELKVSDIFKYPTIAKLLAMKKNEKKYYEGEI